ncbi:MAG TPA: glycine--tRNA ligase [Opitutaceae bacterium]
METLVSLCKRRGIIFPSSEIYGGLNGFFDYGPLGAEIKRNIRNAWWQDMVHRRDDIVGIETSIIMHPKVWEASGHVAGFTDPLVDCKVSKQRYRADQLFFAAVFLVENGHEKQIGYASALESDDIARDLVAATEKVLRKTGKRIPVFAGEGAPATSEAPVYARLGPIDDLSSISSRSDAEEFVKQIPSPATGEAGSLMAPRPFNMMFETYVGALRDESAKSYLRPETAQGMFADFRNVVDTGRVKLPFGIAQIGKSFRNEITPRNYIFRSREFEQMEMEYFIHPDADWLACHEEWLTWCQDWLKSIGLPESHLSLFEHPKAKLAFYSRRTVDIMFKYPFGVQELWGIAARSDYDLQQHQKFSGVPQTWFDEASKTKIVPHVIEPAVGVDRILLAILCAAYHEDEIEGEKRVVLKLHPRIAPYKVGVFPLLKNKPELVKRAQELYRAVKRRHNAFYDESGAIGRRYRRQDEIGTPWCVTVDFETIEKDGTFTLRDRDTLQQVRVNEAELLAMLDEKTA